MDKFFVDSSIWIAYFIPSDTYHSITKKLLDSLILNQALFFTSNDVIDEAVSRLIYTTHPKTVQLFISHLEASIKSHSLVQLWTDNQIQQEAFLLVDKYFDHKLSLTDATSIVLMKHFNIHTVLTLDSDFSKIGLSVLPKTR